MKMEIINQTSIRFNWLSTKNNVSDFEIRIMVVTMRILEKDSFLAKCMNNLVIIIKGREKLDTIGLY
jgi:hypothetical protein